MEASFGTFRRSDDFVERPADAPERLHWTVSDAARMAIVDIESAERDLAGYEADDALARRILRDALARTTYGTVSIEGNPLSLSDVESLLARQGSIEATVPDEREILQLSAFLADLGGNAPPRSPRDVKELHGRVLAGVVPDAGRFKDRANFIGNTRRRQVVYVPTVPERVEPELANALAALDSGADHPLVRAAVFFHEFQSIHPFLDGNGRLGRALTASWLYHHGYAGVRFAAVDFAFNEDRDGYYHALQAARRAGWDLTSWIDYMLAVVAGAYREAVRRFLLRDRIPDLADRTLAVAEWAARLDRGNRGRRFKVNDAQAAFPHVPRRTLQRDLADLVAAGVLERTGAGRGAAYRMAPGGRP